MFSRQASAPKILPRSTSARTNSYFTLSPSTRSRPSTRPPGPLAPRVPRRSGSCKRQNSRLRLFSVETSRCMPRPGAWKRKCFMFNSQSPQVSPHCKFLLFHFLGGWRALSGHAWATTPRNHLMHQSGGEAEGLELPEALLLDTSPAVLAGMSNSPDPSAVPMPHFQTTAQLPPPPLHPHTTTPRLQTCSCARVRAHAHMARTR